MIQNLGRFIILEQEQQQHKIVFHRRVAKGVQNFERKESCEL